MIKPICPECCAEMECTDREKNLWACPNCVGATGISGEGAAATPEKKRWWHRPKIEKRIIKK
jgi:hypothetical protein